MNMILANAHGMPRAVRSITNQEKNIMAFVNEYISEADIEKYGIKEIDEKFRKGHHKPHWTIDREHNMYLRHMHNEHEEHSNRHTYYFHWKGSPLLVTIDVEAEDASGKRYWHYKLWRMEIPEAIKPHESEIRANLKEAFKAYKVRGVFSGDAKFNVDFDF